MNIARWLNPAFVEKVNISLILGVLGFFAFECLILDHMNATRVLIREHQLTPLFPVLQQLTRLGLYSVVIVMVLAGIYVFHRKPLWGIISKATLDITFGAVLGMVVCDTAWIFYSVNLLEGRLPFSQGVLNYWEHMKAIYVAFGALLLSLFFVNQRLACGDPQRCPRIPLFRPSLLALLIPLFSVWMLSLLNRWSVQLNPAVPYQDFPWPVLFFMGFFYMLGEGCVLIFAYRHSQGVVKPMLALVNVIATTWIFSLSLLLWVEFKKNQWLGWSGIALFSHTLEALKNQFSLWFPYLLLLILLMICRTLLKKREMATTLKKNTTGQFGSAQWADKTDLLSMKVHDKNQGIFTGIDAIGKPLYLPLTNKLTLSPPGGGKTTCSSIPVLLSHNGPAFVFDVKGELWAVTARYRAKKFNRKIIVIDPYRIRENPDFCRDKPQDLLTHYTLNPFDWVPEDSAMRDRMINAFAASFVVKENNYGVHFDENAKILIRGYIDYLMRLPATQRNLTTLYSLMSENMQDSQITFDHMMTMSGRAGAAANQINRVGSDERGSILSTSYRQIDWMSDSNMQDTLRESNFELRDFLKGNMDIFVLLPEDQIKEHNRLVRMIMSLLMGLIVQTNPGDLPKQKMLFLLDELAQLGYCPDVEQCIEVLRARGVVVWAVFQTLSQIELFKKPDLFLGAPIKQVFTNDDTKTMEWIQKLGGKRTIITKNKTQNSGDSRQKMRVWGGQVSKGESESVQETGVDLIPLNEIRELPVNEQLIFIQGQKPIRCQKVRYFETSEFAGRWDPNPLE